MRRCSYGPRLIDVDVLFYGDSVVTTETADGPLIVPHERIHERDFVLAPLCDIAPGTAQALSWSIDRLTH